MPSVSSHSSSVTVHPHARGADAGRRRLVPALVGSSPRPWGRCREALREMRHCRFIPTPVGQMPTWTPPRGSVTVHPHARGADALLRLAHLRPAGSSPRPWGRWRVAVHRRRQHRFIPTPVGQMSPARRQARPCAVHPHARGADVTNTPRGSLLAGSSPRPWGRCLAAQRQHPRPRFIPTPVGQIRSGRASCQARTVHPHARGADSAPAKPPTTRNGSSPRPWGRFAVRPPVLAVGRFIPTPVGQMRRERPRRLDQGGSSPRPWGRWSRRRVLQTPPRFIPTPVGQMQRLQADVDRPAVHPHARGADCPGSQWRCHGHGSSPRPWGRWRRLRGAA